MPRLTRVAVAVALALTLAACSRAGEENLGLQKRSVEVDVKRIAEPPELVRALSLPGSELDRLLGARRLSALSTIKMEPAGQPPETLDETFRLDADGKGAVHLLHDNSHGYGLEAIVQGGQVYVRPRYGHFVRRKAEPDDVEQLRDNVEGVAAGYLELLERFVVVKELGRTTIAGRPAIRLALSASPSPPRAPHESEPGKRWRETVQVRYIQGEWLVDAASGAPLGGKLEAAYTFSREGKGPVTVTLDHKEELSAAEPIEAPADAVEATRTRPMLDKEQLLDGLVTPKK